ncbi:MAG: hypothetical protein HN995_09300 [Candidatus Marinimicrobia bacterium]|nr:hypothetical protein [Candidatus Neomarinimicrobiota bacterium]MBT3576323.1 hypothetical protein [Candidatus Neomarinimicrobiota bacterium]MBT3825526.1 hypothetical protein [Candidatus Neomarinimicrobiota bacterium]MBT4129624.1 hypothetical protein [Candidatus Neomarinimicrobiota bacterium]MBT5787254.1 hypothetical protein [Candidatus Neomarinimicrobiota bacterium]
MQDINKSSELDQIDLEAYEELMELVFAYTATAHDFGFTHKMNNRFTSLSMNASFLKQALENKNYEKAIAKATQVSESINNLVKFSQDLMSTNLIKAENQLLEVPSMISDVMGKLLKLPTFTGLEVKQDLSPELINTTSNPGVIWIFLYTFLKHAKRYEIKGPILISTIYDKEQNQYIIKTDVNQIVKISGAKSGESGLVFPSAGEMPFRYLARVIRNVSTKFELIHRAERPLSLELKLNLSLH